MEYPTKVNSNLSYIGEWKYSEKLEDILNESKNDTGLFIGIDFNHSSPNTIVHYYRQNLEGKIKLINSKII